MRKFFDRPVFLNLLWILILLGMNWNRSLWADEWTNLDWVSGSLIDGFRKLYSVGPPYAPGEVVLGWLSRVLFEKFLPLEAWTRIPSMIWSIGSFATIVSIARRQKLPSLPWLALFSAALFWYSGQFRPYAALAFGGVWSLFLLLSDEKKLRTKKVFIVTLAAILFGHIYGICFVAFACLMRKKFLHVIVAAGLVFYVLKRTMTGGTAGTTLHLQYNATMLPSLFDVFKQVFGQIGNPKKVSFLFVLFSGMGLFFLFSKSRKKALMLVMLFSVAVLAPVAATIAGQWVFWPRQVVGGVGVFLFLTSLGIERGIEKIKNKTQARSVVLLILGFLPWFTTVVLKKPNFPDIMIFHFKPIVQKIAETNSKRIFFTDPGETLPFCKYLNARFGDIDCSKPTELKISGIEAIQYCWPAKDVCFITPKNVNDGIVTAKDYAQSGRLHALYTQKEVPFDAIVYHSETFPDADGVNLLMRSW